METQDILEYAVAFVGLVLIISAVSNLFSGYTYGLSGKGRFRREDEPRHFMFLFWSRIILGCACLAIVYFVSTRP